MAAADLDTAIQLADRAYLRFLRDLVACQRGEYGKSLADFDQAIAEQPGNSQFYLGRSGMGHPQAAVNLFDEALRLRPELIYPLRARADVYERTGPFPILSRLRQARPPYRTVTENRNVRSGTCCHCRRYSSRMVCLPGLAARKRHVSVPPAPLAVFTV